MLPDTTLPLPAALMALLAAFQPCFTARPSAPSVPWRRGSWRRQAAAPCAAC